MSVSPASVRLKLLSYTELVLPVSVLTCPSACLSVCGDSILEGAGSVWWGGWDSASSSSCVWLLFQLRNFIFFFNF